jgi:phenylpropionate dioxygenase-like ring-hydroxylating dioxygenase large terminal subunit
MKSTSIPIHTFDGCTTATPNTRSLPPGAFSDPQFHAFELDAVWGHEWFCIGHVSDIPLAGDYYTIQIGKDPLLAVRQEDGSVKVLANVCQHRGFLLAEGRGNVRRIRCPMHSWTYGLSGELISAPGMNEDTGFAKQEACLPVIRSEIWEGFLFVSFDADIAPLAPRLQTLQGQLQNYEMSRLRGAKPLAVDFNEWNWKHNIDECYHCLHLHGKSWGAMHSVSVDRLDENAIYNDAENGIIAYDLISEFPDASPTKTGKALHPILPKLTLEQRKRLAYITVAPNLIIVAMPDKVKYFMWLPASATQCWYGACWMYPESTLAEPEFLARWEKEREDLYPVMVEDYEGWQRYQKGNESRFAHSGRLSPQEKVVGRYQDWLIERYRRADQAAG